MNARTARLPFVFAACVLIACAHTNDSERIGDPDPRPRPKETPVDLSPLKLFRSAFAVTKVGPYEHHFTIWYFQVEPAFEEIRVRRDPATGKLHIAVDNGMWGGIGSPPDPAGKPPPEIAQLQSELQDELHARAPSLRNLIIEYEGTYRTVTLQEMVPTRLEGTTERIGWTGSVVLEADATLTHLTSPVAEYESGFGFAAASEHLRWVDFVPPENVNGRRMFIDLFRSAKDRSPEKTALIDATLEAARRLDANSPGPSIAEIAQKQGDSFLPRDFEQKVRVNVRMVARARDDDRKTRWQTLEFTMPLRLRVAAFGPETATQEAIIGGKHFYFAMTLTPKDRWRRDDPAGQRKFEGTLHWHVHDDRGETIDRDFRAWGDLLVDGTSIATPGGLQIPGASSPSADADRLKAIFPGSGPLVSFEASLSPGLDYDPRD